MQNWLDRCDRADRGRALKLLAELAGEAGFEAACEAFRYACEHQAHDLDSVMALHARLTRQLPELGPLHLAPTIPRLEPLSPDAATYDRMFLPAGSRNGGAR